MKCPVCRNVVAETLIERHHDTLGSGDYRILSCSSCGAVFSDPIRNPGPEWYQRFTLLWGPTAGKEPLVPFWRECFLDRILTLLKDKKPRILDVGCGYGAFLEAARSRGCVVSGIDFDEQKIACAHSRGIEGARVASFKTLIAEHRGRQFDIITFFQVLEHVDDPIAFIETAAALLSPGGYILFDVPNRRGLLKSATGIMDYPPHHLTRWDMATLRGFLARNGFSIIYSDDRLFPLRHFYALLLSWITMHGAGLLKRRVSDGEHGISAALITSKQSDASTASTRPRRLALAVIRALYYGIFVPLSFPLFLILVPAVSARGRGLNCVVAARRNNESNN